MREKKSKSTEEKTSNIGTTKKEKKVKKCKICEALDKVLDKVNNYFFVPFLLILGLTLFGQYYKKSTFGLVVNIMLTAVFFAWIAIIIYKLCRRLTKIAIIWPLIVSLVALITSFITLFAKEAFASNLAFIIGIIFMEVFLIYLIVCDAYDNKNRLSRVIISSILFVTLGYVTIFYSSYGLEDKTIFNSLISIFSAIVGGGLTLGGVAWTIKHGKEENSKKEKKELLNTCSLLSFDKIDLINYDCFQIDMNHPFPNTMMFNGLDKKNLINKNNIFLRFVFNSSNTIPVKNIKFDNITIYSLFVDQKHMGSEYNFTNINYKEDSVNISIIAPNVYQIGIFLVSSINNNKVEELYNSITRLNETTKVFIDTIYSATNINNVSYKAELKFTCNIKLEVVNDAPKIVLSDYEHISNWLVEQPKIVAKD